MEADGCFLMKRVDQIEESCGILFFPREERTRQFLAHYSE